MMKKTLLLGATGHFGQRIARRLAEEGVHLILAGRHQATLETLCGELIQTHPDRLVETAIIDIHKNLDNFLAQHKPFLVINACGPFQGEDYQVPNACITHGCHYFDLADGRDFVSGITSLNEAAKKMDVLVVSGASTVPALSSAFVEAYRAEFSRIDFLKYGITPGQKTDRSLAVTRAILTYVGKPLKAFPGIRKKAYGWQDLYRQKYPRIGKRWMANCDIPDLDLFPTHYGIQKMQFSAGIESTTLHLGLWLLSWLVRFKLPLNLKRWARPMLSISHFFDFFGSGDSGMHVILEGKGLRQEDKILKLFLTARECYGPEIPTIPTVLLTKKLLRGDLGQRGALPCVGLLKLNEYIDALDSHKVTLHLGVK